MPSATSAAASPRLTALGTSLGLRGDFLAADFFLAAMFVLVEVPEDDARRPRVGEIGPGPVDEDDEPAAESDQKEDVEQQPEPPGKDPGETQIRQLRHGGVATDGGEGTPVPIAERGSGPASNERPHVVSHQSAHLLGGWRH